MKLDLVNSSAVICVTCSIHRHGDGNMLRGWNINSRDLAALSRRWLSSAQSSKLRNGRAAGPDGIPPELLQCAIGPVSRALHSLFCQVWRTGLVPSDWRDGIPVALYKGKGAKSECSNYRPITLLCSRKGLRTRAVSTVNHCSKQLVAHSNQAS